MMKRKEMFRRITDIGMTVLLLCLMAYQVTGEQAHEYIGMGMSALVIVHQILNRHWYGALLKGKYSAYRTLMTGINLLLIISFALTAFCGMSMSSYAVPFLYGIAPVSFVRRMHLSMSHWSFVLMGLHLGIHIPLMTAGFHWNEKTKTILSSIFCVLAGVGFFLFLRNSFPAYLLFRAVFAFLDYDKTAALVFLENILILGSFAFTGMHIGMIARNGKDRKPGFRIIQILIAIVIGILLNFLIPSSNASFSSASFPSSSAQPSSLPSETKAPRGQCFVLF